MSVCLPIFYPFLYWLCSMHGNWNELNFSCQQLECRFDRVKPACTYKQQAFLRSHLQNATSFPPHSCCCLEESSRKSSFIFLRNIASNLEGKIILFFSLPFLSPSPSPSLSPSFFPLLLSLSLPVFVSLLSLSLFLPSLPPSGYVLHYFFDCIVLFLHNFNELELG